MLRVAIELDDVALVVQADNDTPPLTFPAVALVREDGLIVGADAEKRRRLEPRRIHDRFWFDLSTEPLRRPFPGGYSTADIAHFHLEHCWQAAGIDTDEVLVAVPGDVPQETLGLVLGVAQAAGVPVVGLVDAAMVAVADHGPAGPTTHLEIFRHRVVATVLDHHDTTLVRRGADVDETVGLAGLEASWARTVAGELVQATRFDPLDRAETEQDLHDQLWGWVDEARRRGAARLSMTAGERVHTVDVTEELFVESAEETYRAIDALVQWVRSERGSQRLFLGHRAAALPRLADRLRHAHGLEVVPLPMAAAANGALRHAGALVGVSAEVVMVVELATGSHWRLPLAKSPAAASQDRRAVGKNPTHVVHRGLAYGIPSAGLVVGTAPPAGAGGLVLVGDTAGVSRLHLTLRREGGVVVVEDHSRFGTHLNDVPLDVVTAVGSGDRLRVGAPGIVLELVTVVGGDGST